MSTKNENETAVEKLRAMVRWFDNSNEIANDRIESIEQAEAVFDAMRASAFDCYVEDFPPTAWEWLSHVKRVDRSEVSKHAAKEIDKAFRENER